MGNLYSGLAVGRVVHYVMNDSDYEPGARFTKDSRKHRAAIVTEVMSKNDGWVNLMIFPDGSNDQGPTFSGGLYRLLWRASVKYSATEEPGTWHWPEKVD